MRLRLAVLLLLTLCSAAPASAELIKAVFGGALNHVCGNFVPGTDCDGFGVGLSVGDHFEGSLAYDSITGNPSYFDAVVGSQTFDATNLVLGVVPFDGFLTGFYVRGQINGLFMAIALTSGSPVLTDASPPTSLDSSDWTLGAFAITKSPTTALESGCCAIDSIYGAYPAFIASPSDFFLRTVPVSEPDPLTLIVGGLLLLVFVRRVAPR